jgi:hypothetical protein
VLQTWLEGGVGMPALSDTPIAVSRDGRWVASQRQRFEPRAGQPPLREGWIAVTDAYTQATRFETPAWSMPLSASPFGSMGRRPRAAAFSADHRRLLVDHTRPACPDRLVMTPAMLPIEVPSCPDQRTTLTVWDLEARRPVRELTYEWTPGADGGAAMPGLMPLSTGGSRAASLGLPDDAAAVRTMVDAVPSSGRLAVRVRLATERIALDQPDALPALACTRLPQRLRAIAPDDWAQALPGERHRAICETLSGAASAGASAR